MGAAILDFVIGNVSAVLFAIMLVWNISLHRASARKSELDLLSAKIEGAARKTETDQLKAEIADLERKHYAERDKTREKLAQIDIVLKAVPGSDAVHQLQIELTRMAGDINVMSEVVKVVKRSTDRIDTYLMKEKAG